MTTADTAADARAGDAAANSPDAPNDVENAPMQGAHPDRKIEDGRVGMSHSVRQAQARLRRARTEVRQHAREVSESSVDYIRQNPWSAIGISAGIGLLVGVIFGRRPAGRHSHNEPLDPSGR